MTLRWRPGEASLDRLERLHLDRVTARVMRGNRVVLSIFGGARDGARDARGARRGTASTSSTRCAARRRVRDVVIWNEANSPRFWRPAGRAPAAAYVALLARCYDVVHEQSRGAT